MYWSCFYYNSEGDIWRMRSSILFFVSVTLFCLGVLFMGKGITGYVISESCCLPPNCAEENICSFYETPSNIENDKSFFLGMIFLVLCAIIYLIWLATREY